MYDYTYYDYGSTVGGILGGLAIILMVISIIALAVSIVLLIAQWKLFKKAGKGGWEAIVPFYCNYVLVEIAGLKWYWFLGFFAPLVLGAIPGIGFLGWLAYLFTMFNIFFNISKRFNKGIGFAICLTLFTPICVPILGFSSKEKYDSSVPVSPNGVFGQPETQNDNSNVYQQPVQTTYEQPSQPQVQPMQQPVMPVVEPIISVPQVEPVVPVQQIQPTVSQNPIPKFCTNCGGQLLPNARFCTNCGKQI